MTHKCRRCGQEKPAKLFYTYNNKRLHKCKPCLADIQREYRKRRPKGYWQHKDKRYALKKQYGITLEEYEARVKAQGGRCAICGANPRTKIGPQQHALLHVDHDHQTGQVRELLCNGCNRAIGFVRDNPETALGLAEYLFRWMIVDADGVAGKWTSMMQERLSPGFKFTANDVAKAVICSRLAERQAEVA